VYKCVLIHYDFQSPPEEVSAAVDAALELGYRHIDTAYLYENEAAIGKILKKWFDSGRLKREDIFIVTKVNKAEKYAFSLVETVLINQPISLFISIIKKKYNMIFL
jgi:diketogulonate reductase-like aldo/keto reductase